jgi:hypothetical protein
MNDTSKLPQPVLPGTPFRVKYTNPEPNLDAPNGDFSPIEIIHYADSSDLALAQARARPMPITGYTPVSATLHNGPIGTQEKIVGPV